MAQLKKGREDVGSLLAPLQEPKESVEVRMPILTEDFPEPAASRCISGLEAYAKVQRWLADCSG